MRTEATKDVNKDWYWELGWPTMQRNNFVYFCLTNLDKKPSCR